MSMLNATSVALCVLTILSAVTLAQSGSSLQSTPRFTSQTELVNVPVVVLRHATPWRQLQIRGSLDEHVEGLTKDDFEIEEDGRPRPIAFFEEVRGSKSPVRRGAAPQQDSFTNEVMSDGPVTTVVFVLDLINTPYFHQTATKEKLLQYLERGYKPDCPAMLVALHPNGLRILHDFTADPKLLVAIVRRLKNRLEHDTTLDHLVTADVGNAIAGQIDVKAEYDAMDREFFDTKAVGPEVYELGLKADRLEATFTQLQQLAHGLSALPGMKSLVWATGGFVLPLPSNSRSSRVLDEYVHTLKLLSAAGLTVYPIDTVMETDNPAYSSPQLASPGAATSRMPLPSRIQIVQNFMEISQRTGGDYCLLRKDPDLCFQKAVDYVSRYYLLSYYAQHSETIRWHKINVKVRGADLQVRARSGYFSAGLNPDPERRRLRDITQALAAPLDYRGIPVTVRWAGTAEGRFPEPGRSTQTEKPPMRPSERNFVLQVSPAALTVDAADHNHIQLDIVVAALDRRGRVLADVAQQIDLRPDAAALQQLRSTGISYSNAIRVPPETSKVRFIVRDDLGERLGSVSALP